MPEMSTQSVSIIIVTAGKNSHTQACLDSVRQQAYAPLSAILIDNSLNSNFLKSLNFDRNFFKVFSPPRNLFYCDGLNKGIAMSTGEFILCLNDDVTLKRDFIQQAVRGFLIDKRIGMVSGKIMRLDGRSIDSTGLCLTLARTAKERGYGLKDSGQFDQADYIFGVNGAVAFYRRTMLEDIKEGQLYFDSGFRMFYEDLDIAWRAQNHGWKGYYLPSALAYHARGLSVRTNKGLNKKAARLYLSDELHLDLIKNRYLTIIKNESLAGFFLHLPFILIYDLFIWGFIFFFKFNLVKKFISSAGIFKSALIKRARRK